MHNKASYKRLGILLVFLVLSIAFVYALTEIKPIKVEKWEKEIDNNKTGNDSGSKLFFNLPPVVVISDVEINEITHQITATATDDNGLVWLKIYENGVEKFSKDCSDTTCFITRNIIKYVCEPTTFEYYARAMDIDGSTGESEHINVVFNNHAPVIEDYSPSILTPQVNENSSLYFEVNAYDPDGGEVNYTWLLDGEIVKSGKNENNYVYTPDFFDAGYHQIVVVITEKWGCSKTIVWNVTVNNVLIPTSCQLYFTPPSPISYDEQPFTAYCSCNSGEANATMWRDGIDVTNEIGIPVTLAANPNGYLYVCNVTETENYASASNQSVYVINKAETTLSLDAVPSWQITYGESVNISCQANNDEVLLNLYINGSNVASGYDLIYDFINAYELAAGSYEVSCVATESQNYTSASVSNTLTINKAQTQLSLIALPSWNVVYGTKTNVSCYANHNQAPVFLYRNNQLVQNPDIAILAAGNYMYTCNISESQNYTAASISNLLSVNKANSQVNLLLNGIDGDIDVNISDLVGMNASLVLGLQNQQPNPIIESLPSKRLKQGPFTLYLYLDGNVVAFGDYQVLYNKTFDINEVGLHNVTAYFPGNENYTASYETHFVNVLPDTQPPSIFFIPPTPDNSSVINIDFMLIRVNATDNIAIDSVWLEFDGVNETMLNEVNGIYYLNKTSLANGWHVFRAWANDTSGNIASTEQRMVYVDIQQPIVTIYSPLNQTYNTSLIDLNYTTTDNIAVDSCWYTLDDGLTNISLPNCQNTTLNLSNGFYHLIVYANDTVGNIGFDDVYFTINITLPDTEPPVVIIESPLNITYTTSSIWINITATDNVAVDSIWYSINNGPNITYTAPVLQNFADGNYLFEAWANDTSGNIGYAYVIFTVNTTTPDIEPPIVTLIAPPNASITGGNVTVVYNVTDNMASTLSCDIYSNTSGNWQIDTSQVVVNASTNSYDYYNLADGYYVWNVRCFDGNNYAFAPENFSFIVNTTIPDIEPPIIIFVPPTPDNGTTLSRDWVYINTTITDNVAVSIALLEWNGVNETMNGAEPNYWVNKTNLSDGTYVYRVYASDTSGNWNVSETRIVYINTTIPNTPPYVELIWPDDGYIHNSTSINLSFYAHDDLSNLLDCWLYTNITGNWQQTDFMQIINASTNNFSLNSLENGVYLWNVECSDGTLSSFAIANRTFIINVTHDVGIDESYSNSINGIRLIDVETNSIILDDPANLTYGKNYSIRARIMNYGNLPENIRVIIKIANATNEFVLANYTTTINQWHYTEATFNTSDYALGNYFAVVHVDLLGYVDQNLSNNERNRSFNIVQLVDMPPYWTNETTSPVSPTTYGNGPYNFSIIWHDDYGISNVIFEFNGINYTPICNPSLPANDTLCYYAFNDLAAGTYGYRWYANDTAGQWNSTNLLSYVINRADPSAFMHLALNGVEADLSIVYGTQSNATGWFELSSQDLTFNLYRNSSLVATGSPASEIALLGAGVYVYEYNTSGGQNYTAASITRVLNVTKATSQVNLLLNGTDGNITVNTNELVNITCQLLNPASGYVEVYDNETIIGSGNAPIEILTSYASEGLHNITCIYPETQNYSSSFETHWINVTQQVILPGEIHLWLNGTEGNLTINYADNPVNITAYTPYGNVSIYLNGTLLGEAANYYETIKQLAAGYYNVTAYSTGDATHMPASVTYFLTIEKANSSITLLLNGSNADITILQGETVNHTAILNTPSVGIVRILLNGTEMASGNSPLEWLYNYVDTGYYNVTAIFDGNQNYTSSMSSHFVTVNPVVHDIAVISISYNKSSSTVYNNDIILIKANVTNLGNTAEQNVNITLSDNNNVVAWQLVNIAVGQTIEVNFTWQASAAVNSNEWHVVEVYAKPVAGETNLTNNAQILSIQTWHACAVIDCTQFFPVTLSDVYSLGESFTVFTEVTNGWNNKNFYDFPARLEVTSGLVILPTWPQQQYIDLPAGNSITVRWNVTSIAVGNQTLTTIAGNNDYSASKNITIT